MTQLLTPVDALLHWTQEHPERVYLRQPIAGEFQERTWAMVADETARIAAGLQAQGLERGDKVAILAKNSAEWFIIDLAITMAGCVSVPIYSTANADTVRYILEHSESKLIVVGKLDNPDAQAQGIPEGIARMAMPYPTIESEHQWSDWLKQYEPLADPAQWQEQDIMTLIYTSGSTGEPKGAEVSFGAYRAGSLGWMEVFQPTKEDRAISYLPLAHITERVLLQGVSLYNGGVVVSFVESLDTFADNLQSVQPTMFLSVPRLWARFQQAVFEKLPPKKLHFLLKVPVIGGLIRKKIRTNLGLHHARLLGCGSAPVAPALLEWYRDKLGLNIAQAWGMTENMAYGTVNLPYRADKYDTIGKASPGVELKISDEGELLMRSEAMMTGYYKHPELNDEFFSDGWMHTGDKGSIDADGYVKIIGRVKESFKTTKGKYVAPVPIEQKLAENSMVEQVCVCGQALTQPIALVVLADELHHHSQEQIVNSLTRTVKEVNSQIESHARIAHVLVVDQQWSIENGLLTPTLKIRRPQIEKHYDALIHQQHSQLVDFERDDNWGR